MNANLLAHEQEQYEAFLARMDKMEATNQEMLSDAEKAGDTQTAWLAKTHLAKIKEFRKTIRKPGEPRR